MKHSKEFPSNGITLKQFLTLQQMHSSFMSGPSWWKKFEKFRFLEFWIMCLHISLEERLNYAFSRRNLKPFAPLVVVSLIWGTVSKAFSRSINIPMPATEISYQVPKYCTADRCYLIFYKCVPFHLFKFSLRFDQFATLIDENGIFNIIVHGLES